MIPESPDDTWESASFIYQLHVFAYRNCSSLMLVSNKFLSVNMLSTYSALIQGNCSTIMVSGYWFKCRGICFCSGILFYFIQRLLFLPGDWTQLVLTYLDELIWVCQLMLCVVLLVPVDLWQSLMRIEELHSTLCQSPTLPWQFTVHFVRYVSTVVIFANLQHEHCCTNLVGSICSTQFFYLLYMIKL